MTQFFDRILNTLGSGVTAYILANRIRDQQTRPQTIAGFQLAEAGAVPFLTKLATRAAQENHTWLEAKLKLHADDEKRHSQIFAHGLKQLGKEVQPPDKLNRQQSASPFFSTFYRGYEPESLRAEIIEWPVFMASTYILELDASKDFARMAAALPEHEPTSRRLKQGILAIARDETRHASYLYEAMQRTLTAPAVEQLVAEWRQRKIEAMFAMVQDLIKTGGSRGSLVQDAAPDTLATEPILQTAEAR